MGILHYTTLKLHIKELGEGNFFGLSFASVHQTDPFHLIGFFQFFVYSCGFGNLWDKNVKTVFKSAMLFLLASRVKSHYSKRKSDSLIISILQPFSLYSIAFLTLVPYVPLEYA